MCTAVKPPTCRQCPGPPVANHSTAWSWDVIMVYCLISRLHYMLLQQQLGNHAESERKPFPPGSILGILLFVNICRQFAQSTSMQKALGMSLNWMHRCCCRTKHDDMLLSLCKCRHIAIVVDNLASKRKYRWVTHSRMSWNILIWILKEKKVFFSFFIWFRILSQLKMLHVKFEVCLPARNW